MIEVLFGLLGVLAPIAILIGIVLAIDTVRERLRARAPRTRLDRWSRRRRRLPVFAAFFVVWTASILLWFLFGLAATVVRTSPSLHEALHRRGGVLDVARADIEADGPEARFLKVKARNGDFNVREITLRAGGEARILFENVDLVEHNLALYASPTDEEPLFQSELIRAVRVTRRDDGNEYEEDVPASRHLVFPAPRDSGTYWFRCDVHPRTMNGPVTVLAPGVGPDTAPHPFGFGDVVGGLPDLARRLAEASHLKDAGWQVGLDYFFGALSLVLAVWLVRLRPRDRVARFFGVALVGTAAAYNLGGHAAKSFMPMGGFLHDNFIHALAGIPFVCAVVLFPDGSLVPRFRHRRVRIAYATVGLLFLTGILGAFGVLGPAPDLGHMVNFLQFFGLFIPAVGFLSQGYRVWRAPTVEERQRSKLLMAALVPAFFAGVAFFVLDPRPDLFFGASTLPRDMFRWFQPVFALIPIALFVGILRYHLWDVDLVVNRALVYGSLAGFIGAVYVVVVVLIGHAVGAGGRPNTALTILATGLVAVAFEPLRERVQRVANRLVYGERATPYEVMQLFSLRLSGALSLDEVLPRMAETAARGVGAARSRVRLFLPDGGERAVGWPDDTAHGTFDRSIPVVHQGEAVGEIAVATPPGAEIAPAEERLLQAIADQAGVAMQGIRLAEELRGRLDEISARAEELSQARRRIVAARVALRRRLEREIRDRVEAQLATMAPALEEAERLIRGDPERAVAVLDGVTERSNVAIETLRELAHGIYPPLLADRGLVAALEAQARKAPVAIGFQADPGLAGMRFDPQVEAAVYFCCVEALKNVAMHAPAASAELLLGLDEGWLAFHVSDDGPGFDPRSLPEDSVLQDMVERVGMLGGTVEVRSAPGRGTTLEGRVPAQPPVATAQAASSRSGANADLGI